MKKSSFIFFVGKAAFLKCLLIFITHASFSQAPLTKLWDYRFGGMKDERLTAFIPTFDGGFLLGGTTTSDSGGNKSEPHWGLVNSDLDYWIVKLDSAGNKQWDRDLGGTEADYLYAIQQTSDGGYIVAGYSYSNISGCKTEPRHGFTDYWMLKLDSAGVIEWDRDLGGGGQDHLSCITQTADGGYVLGGSSASSIGWDKSEDSRGLYDYWIIKTDSTGIRQWDKTFGGNQNDELTSVVQTPEGGYLLGGQSWSGISGDKTEPNRHSGLVTSDYWIVKTDALGNKIWDKTFGGYYWEYVSTVLLTAEGGYLIAGSAQSDSCADKTQNSWGADDYWIIKTDSAGNKIWDRDFGGTNTDRTVGNIARTIDGGYVMSGLSKSPASGNKTQGNLGLDQTWTIKTDSLGNLQWDRTLLVNWNTEQGYAVETKDTCIVMANFNNGWIAGDKSQNPWGNGYDYWVIKFCPTVLANFVSPSNLCPGACADFLNTSYNAISYLWHFPGAVPDSSTDVNPSGICYPNPGSYTVTLHAYSLLLSDSLTLTNVLSIYPFAVDTILQFGDTLVADSGAVSYQWYHNGNVISGATDYYYVAMSNGDYEVEYTDVFGCQGSYSILSVLTAALPSPDRFTGFLISPNPVRSSVIIQCPVSFSQLQIADATGRILRTETLPENTLHKELDVSNFAAGIYFVVFESKEGKVTIKMAKE
jgi:hypothetical protein